MKSFWVARNQYSGMDIPNVCVFQCKPERYEIEKGMVHFIPKFGTRFVHPMCYALFVKSTVIEVKPGTAVELRLVHVDPKGKRDAEG